MKLNTIVKVSIPVFFLYRGALLMAAAVLSGGCSIDLGFGDARSGLISYEEDQKGQYFRHQLRVVGIPIYARNINTNLPPDSK